MVSPPCPQRRARTRLIDGFAQSQRVFEGRRDANEAPPAEGEIAAEFVRSKVMSFHPSRREAWCHAGEMVSHVR